MKKNKSILFPDILTEKTISELFADRFGGNIRYDHKRKRFLLWSGNFWLEDRTEGTTRLLMNFSEMITDEGHEDENKELANWGIKLQSRSKISNILSITKACLPIALTGDEFDISPFLLGVANGIVNLQTGELEEGNQNQYISLFSPIIYDPSAQCPKWEKFLQDVFEGDDDLIHYIHRALGYSITASMREQLFFICYGEGANGKSKLFSIINKILGEYSATVSSNMFKKNPNYTATNDIADIDRKRFITNAESIKQQAMDEEKLKSISGGDRITARRLHENNFSFYPVCKIWLYTNNTPRFDDDSYGLWRRIRVIRFPHKFEGKERNDDIEDELMEEAPGILRWLVEGALIWQKEGLRDIPVAVAQATQNYKAENNPLSEYLADRCVMEEGEKVSCTLLYTDYKLWMADRRKTPLTQTTFGRKVIEIPKIERKHEIDGNYYINLRMQIF